MGRNLLIRWGLNITGILLTAYLTKGFDVAIPGARVGFVFLGFVNAAIRPIILLLTLPIL